MNEIEKLQTAFTKAEQGRIKLSRALRDKEEELRIAKEAMSIGTRLWEGNLTTAKAERDAAMAALRNLVAAESIPNAEIDMIQARAELAREGNLRSEGVSEETIQARARVLWADVPRLTAEVIRLNAHLAAAKEVLK